MITIKAKYNQANIMLEEQQLEEETRKQIYGFLNHPAFADSYIAIMPDCLHPDTEVLTTDGFKFIRLLKNIDKIANFNPLTKEIFFEKPKEIIIRPTKPKEGIYSLSSTRLGELSVQTDSHRNAYKPKLGCTTESLPPEINVKDLMWGAELYTVNETVSDSFLKFVAWIVGDGNIKKTKNQKSTNYRIRFGLKKKRKIDRILELLDDLNISPKVCKTSKQTEIYLNTKDSAQFIDVVTLEKKYPKKYIHKLSLRQKVLFIDEAIQVDGDFEAFKKRTSYRFNSSKKEDLDFLSALCSFIGYSSIKISKGFSNFLRKDRINYYLTFIPKERMEYNRNGLHNSKIKVEKKLNSTIKEVVCVTCASGFFVYRYKNRTGITGNCHAGSGSCIGFTMTGNKYVIPNVVGVDIGCGVDTMCLGKIDVNLKEFDSFVRETIPAGFKVRQKPIKVDNKYEKETLEEVYKLSEKVGSDPDRNMLAYCSMGGGNHFLELGKDEDDCLWLTIHTGSRKFGLDVCRYHQNRAKDLMKEMFTGSAYHRMEFMPLDKGGQGYIEDMYIAQDFAMRNRIAILRELFPFFKMKFNVTQGVSSVHNYISPDDGIVRKGAISAYSYQDLVIPFNMEDGLIIGTGKGNKKWNYSAPHGAGRLMSRTKAKASLNLDETKQSMEDAGVYTTSLNESSLDEAKGAYKDKDMILEAIKETVDVKHFVKPIYNFKASN